MLIRARMFPTGQMSGHDKQPLPTDEKPVKSVVLAVASAILFAIATPAGKLLLGELSTFQLAGMLYLGAALGLFLPMANHKPHRLPWEAGVRGRVFFLIAVLCGGIVAPVLMLLGLTKGSAASTSVWLSLEPIFTVLLACTLFKEQLGKLASIGVSGCLLACILLSLGESGCASVASLCTAMACLCWALDNNCTALIDGLTATEIAFWKGLIAGTVNLTIGLSLHPLVVNASVVCVSLILGAIAYGASIVCFICAAQKMGAVRAQLVFATAPGWGVILSALFLHETVTGFHIAATLVFIGSLILLFRKDEHAHWHDHQALEHTHFHTHDDGHHDHSHQGNFNELWHSHWHSHDAVLHSHSHLPDVHHRHDH